MLAAQGARLLIAAMATPVGDDPEASTCRRRRDGQPAGGAGFGERCGPGGGGGGRLGPQRGGRYAAISSPVRRWPLMRMDNGRRDAGGRPREACSWSSWKSLAAPCRWLSRRRPSLYQPLVAEEKPSETFRGRGQKDWDAQGETHLEPAERPGVLLRRPVRGSRARTGRPRNRAVVVTTPSLPPLAGYRVVLLTRPCLAQLPAEEAGKLSRWVAGGGTLILDGYCGRNSESAGAIDGDRRPDAPRGVPAVLPGCLAGDACGSSPPTDDAVFAGLDPRPSEQGLGAGLAAGVGCRR